MGVISKTFLVSLLWVPVAMAQTPVVVPVKAIPVKVVPNAIPVKRDVQPNAKRELVKQVKKRRGISRPLNLFEEPADGYDCRNGVDSAAVRVETNECAAAQDVLAEFLCFLAYEDVDRAFRRVSSMRKSGASTKDLGAHLLNKESFAKELSESIPERFFAPDIHQCQLSGIGRCKCELEFSILSDKERDRVELVEEEDGWRVLNPIGVIR